MIKVYHQSEIINDNLLELSNHIFENWINATESTTTLSLTDIASYKNGVASQKFRPLDGEPDLPVLKIKELNQGFTDSASNRVSAQINNDVKVYDGDVIFSWSGTLLIDIWTGGRAGLNQHLFKVTSVDYPKWFYFLWTNFHLRNFQWIASSKATTMGHIKRSDLSGAKVTIPTDNEFDSLDTVLTPIVNQYISNGTQTKKLIVVRDSLLQSLFES